MVLTARPYMEPDRNMYKFWGMAWTLTDPVWYRLTGPTISFIPYPTNAFSINLNYVPICPLMSDPTQDSFDGINGWEAYAVWKAVAMCKQKGEEDTSFALAEMEKLRTRIEGLAPDRAAGDAERVHDVTAGYAPLGGFGVGGGGTFGGP
jgi:hypothetical protein